MCSFHTCEVGVTMVRISHGRVGIPRRTPGTPKSAWPAVNTAWRAGRKRGARAGRRSEQGARGRPAEDDRRRPTPAGTPRLREGGRGAGRPSRPSGPLRAEQTGRDVALECPGGVYGPRRSCSDSRGEEQR